MYGLCKYVAERELICSGNLNSAIIRLSKIIDPNFKLFDKWVSQLNSGECIKPLKMAVSPISLELTSNFINKVVVSGANGIFHLSALADTTYVEVAKHTCT